LVFYNQTVHYLMSGLTTGSVYASGVFYTSA
jgi:hypothetical protein